MRTSTPTWAAVWAGPEMRTRSHNLLSVSWPSLHLRHDLRRGSGGRAAALPVRGGVLVQ